MSNLSIITGPPGSGKTTLLNELRERGLNCVEEPARTVLRQQRLIGGKGTSDQDPNLFVHLMLAHAMEDFERLKSENAPVVFDRGIPDLIGYATYYNLDRGPFERASRHFRYNCCVFFAPPWRDIYVQDDERTISFERAREFGALIGEGYKLAGYELIDLPFNTPRKRANFVENKISKDNPSVSSG